MDMFNIKFIHIFIILLLLKFISLYIDKTFLFLLLVVAIFIYYYIDKNKIDVKIDLPLIESIKNTSIKNDKNSILILLNEYDYILNMNSYTKKELIENINIYIENISLMLNNKIKNCDYYIDSLKNQINEIMNLASSLIIVQGNYEKYDYFKEFINKLKSNLSNMFKTVQDKCKQYKPLYYVPSNEYNNKNSFKLY
jgi:hypothetical protein